jgi:HSP20 family protein
MPVRLAGMIAVLFSPSAGGTQSQGDEEMLHTRNVFHPLWNQFQSEMNRLFDRWGDEGGQQSWTTFPPLNVWEQEDNLYVEAELPGLKIEDIEIFVTGNNQLTLKGERKPLVVDKGIRHRQERGVGKFVRTLTLPFPVNPDTVDARFENGVLQIKLAKHESAKARKINVKGE